LTKPFFVRNLGRSQAGGAWSTFCGLLRAQGIPIFSTVAALQDVPGASVPARMGRRFINEPLDAVELQTADVFEVACCDVAGQRWGWTSEVAANQLRAYIDAIRQAAGGDTPVGIGLPVNCHETDLRACLEAEVDFISLESAAASLAVTDIHAVASARRMCRQLGQAALPLLVSLPLSDPHQALKVLALGASAISLDSLLSGCFPKPPASPTAGVGSGMLSGISTGPRKTVGLPDVERTLERLNQTLQTTLNSIGAKNLNQLNVDCLRSCTQRSLGISGAQRLSLDDTSSQAN
jgi:hypothetical protein